MELKRINRAAAWLSLTLAAVIAGSGRAADDAAPDSPSKAATPASLSSEQKQIAERFDRLKEKLLRMAELTAPSDPRRAALLRKAVAQANDRGIDAEFSQLVELLGQEQLSSALKAQGTVHQDLTRLLELLLSEDRTKRLQSEKERIREYIKRVNIIIKKQKELQGETAGEAETPRLGDEQEKLAGKTGELARDFQKTEGGQSGTPGANDKATDDKQKGQEGPQGEGQPKDKDPSKGKGKADGDKKDNDKDKGKDKAGGKGDSQPKADKADQSQGQDEAEAEDGQGEGKQGADGKAGGQPKDNDKKDKDRKDKDKGQDKDKEQDKNSPPGEGESKGEGQGEPQDQKKNQSPGQPPQPGQGQGQGEGGDQDDSEQPAAPPEENPVQKHIQQAEQRMRDAQRKLEEAKRHDAVEKQEEAKRELELAKAELEAILRQLREEEVARMLAQLEGRFRKMLEAQIEVYEGTKRVDRVPRQDRDRDHEIEAGRLSRKEAGIVAEADKALIVLREEGSAVAFPEAVSDMRDDMEQIVVRLAQAKVGQITQGIEEDVIVALEELIAALQKAQKDLDKKAQPMPGQMGQPGEAPLVDAIAEIKMIRSMQLWVNKRTKRYAELTKTEQAEQPELLTALKRLSEREQRIHRITRDIVVGRNE